MFLEWKHCLYYTDIQDSAYISNCVLVIISTKKYGSKKYNYYLCYLHICITLH
jgi:hypothetical protein